MIFNGMRSNSLKFGFAIGAVISLGIVLVLLYALFVNRGPEIVFGIIAVFIMGFLVIISLAQKLGLRNAFDLSFGWVLLGSLIGIVAILTASALMFAIVGNLFT